MGVKVRQRNGAWWLYIDHRGQRKAKRVGEGKAGKKAADDAAVQIRARLTLGDTGILEPEQGGSPTFRDLAEESLARYPLVNSISETTQENYTSFATRHLIPYFGAMPVNAITTDTVEDFIASRRQPGGSRRFEGKPLSESTLRTGL